MTYDYARLAKIKCFLFDMDGTINLGNELIPGMEGFFDKLKAAGKEYYLLTNNSSRSHEHYVQKMNGLGVPVTRENILISSDALTNWMQKNKPGAKLFVLGTPQLLATIEEAGFTLTNTLEEGADYVVVGFDQTQLDAEVSLGARTLRAGDVLDRSMLSQLLVLPAENRDASCELVYCPIEGGEFIPDTGAMLELIKTATGKKPQLIFGKPYKYMVDVVLDKTGYNKEEIAMVGDRLATDIAFGLNNDILSVMVLTGEATMEDVENGSIKPDIILPHAKEILQYLG